MPIIAAWTVRRCDASTDKWIVDLTFAVVGLTAVLPAPRLRVLVFPLSDASDIMPPLLIDVLVANRLNAEVSDLEGVMPLLSASPPAPLDQRQ